MLDARQVVLVILDTQVVVVALHRAMDCLARTCRSKHGAKDGAGSGAMIQR